MSDLETTLSEWRCGYRTDHPERSQEKRPGWVARSLKQYHGHGSGDSGIVGGATPLSGGVQRPRRGEDRILAAWPIEDELFHAKFLI